jgi:hypothetical protein
MEQGNDKPIEKKRPGKSHKKSRTKHNPHIIQLAPAGNGSWMNASKKGSAKKQLTNGTNQEERNTVNNS